MTARDRATFAARWRQAVAGVPDEAFLVWEGPSSEMTWTYREFDELVDRVASGLAERGLEPGAAVHVALRNCPAFVAVWLAATQLGAWIVPSDPAATRRELRDHLARTTPAVGVCSIDRADVYREAAPDDMSVVEVAEDDTELSGLHGTAARSPRHLPRPGDRAAVMFTSGTTSAPKGVVVTQANYAFAGDVMAAAAALTHTDRQLVVLPLFHANAQYYSFAPCISAGASVALIHRFSASGFLEQAARHRATHASLFAAPMRMILARGGSPSEQLRLRHVWYAQNVTREQYGQFSQLFGCRPRQLYGMTETIPAVLTNRALDAVPDAMGIPTLGCEVELVEPDGTEPVSDGETGEVVVRGERGITLFAEYLDDTETTTAAFRDGWFHTADLARRDADGNFHFAGRRSDVLKVAGENVSVVEVEEALGEHPRVLEAAVVGEPDPIRDEVPVAYVVQAPGAPPIDVASLAAHCKELLAPAKRPRQFHVVDELPRTSVGKIRKAVLQRPIEEGADT